MWRQGNLAFAQSLVDQFAGDPSLISLRSRASAAQIFAICMRERIPSCMRAPPEQQIKPSRTRFRPIHRP